MSFRQIRELGHSNFGRVLLVEDKGTGRLAALKILDPSRIARPVDQVFDEATALAEAESDFVVGIYTADYLPNGLPYLLMEYVQRGSVRDYHGAGPLAVREAVQATIDACHGLEVVHNQGLLHRDVKPANLLLGDEGRVMLSDFGLSCVQSDPDDMNYSYSPHLPPEDLAAQQITSIQGDIYSMALTAYRLLNGDVFLEQSRLPGEDVQDAIAAGRYPDLRRWQPHVPDRVRRAIRQGMHRELAKRPDAVWEFRGLLEDSLPEVSWAPNATGTGWRGISVDGSAEWFVDISNLGQRFELLVRRGSSGKKPRRRGKVQTFAAEADANAAARVVLERIAATGDDR